MKSIFCWALFVALSLVWIINVIPAMAQGTNDVYWSSFGVSGDSNAGGNALKWSNGVAAETQKWSNLLTTIQKTINWLLGLLATIALVICLYAGFLMVTAVGNDANHKKGMTVLKQAAIWLVIIGLAWLIVSVVFWVVWTMSA